MILGLILQQALSAGRLGYRRRLLRRPVGLPAVSPPRGDCHRGDLWLLAGIVAGISVLASLLGIAKALRVEPNEVLA